MQETNAIKISVNYIIIVASSHSSSKANRMIFMWNFEFSRKLFIATFLLRSCWFRSNWNVCEIRIESKCVNILIFLFNYRSNKDYVQLFSINAVVDMEKPIYLFTTNRYVSRLILYFAFCDEIFDKVTYFNSSIR